VWRRRETALDEEFVRGIIQLLMRIDANVARILEVMDEDGEEEADA
jgi:hypothetical protein